MIRVHVCDYCGATRAIVTAVKQAQETHAGRIVLDFAQCLNECHNLPVIKVNGELVPDATPPVVLRAIDRALAREPANG